MKVENLYKKTGLCHICGRPTKLLIHKPCGQKADAAKVANKVFRNINQQQRENASHNAKKRMWAAGNLPPFCKT